MVTVQPFCSLYRLFLLCPCLRPLLSSEKDLHYPLALHLPQPTVNSSWLATTHGSKHEKLTAAVVQRAQQNRTLPSNATRWRQASRTWLRSAFSSSRVQCSAVASLQQMFEGFRRKLLTKSKAQKPTVGWRQSQKHIIYTYIYWCPSLFATRRACRSEALQQLSPEDGETASRPQSKLLSDKLNTRFTSIATLHFRGGACGSSKHPLPGRVISWMLTC